MKDSTFVLKRPRLADAVDGPGWTDVVVDGYYDNNGNYVPPKYRSSKEGNSNNNSLASKNPNFLTKLVLGMRNLSGFEL